MAIQGNFADIIDDFFCSPQAADDRGAGLILEKMYDKINLDQIFTLVAPVRTGDPVVSMVLPAIYNAINNTEATDCTIDACDISPEYSAKKWAIVIAECRHTLCTRTLDDTFLAFWNKYKRVNPGSSEYDFVVDQITEMLADLLANTLLAKLWLSDTTFQAVPGTAADTLDGIDGFLPQFIGNTDNMVDVGTALLDGEALYDAISEAIEQYKFSTFGDTIGSAKIYLDREDALRLTSWLNKQGRMTGADCLCVDPDGVVRGDRYTIEGLQINGIPVVVQPFRAMMRQFETLYVNADVLVYPNFFAIVSQEALLIGSGNEDDLAEMKVWYSNETRTYNFDIGYSYGAMVANNNFVYGLGTTV